jgi:tetratricopeptide (TPR) repeat protein
MSTHEQLEKRVAGIRSILDTRDTEDLLEIWKANDHEEWTDEAFTAIQSILLDRLGEVPPQTPRYQPADLADDPDLIRRAERYLQRAAGYLEQGRYQEAMFACGAAIRVAPHLATAYDYLGLSYNSLGQMEEAIAAYREAVRLDPRFDEAKEHLREAEAELEQAPQIAAAWEYLDRAMDLVDQDELEAALQQCELAFQTAPSLADAQNYRGMILEELERLEDAIDAYHTAVQLNAEFEAARENLYCARLKWEAALFHPLSIEAPEHIEEEGAALLAGNEDVEMAWDDLPDMDETFARYSGGLPPFFLDEKALILSGWPGYRTRPGRSGYDPLDNEFELAHMEGVILRLLFTGKFRTSNPLSLFLMFFWGCLGCLSLVFTLGEALNGQPNALFFNLFFFPYIAVGAALLWNASLSLLDWGVDEARINS